MIIQTTIKQWIEKRIDEAYPELEGIQLAITGEEDDLENPYIGIYESGQSIHEANGVVMYGVTDFDIKVDLTTVPASEDQEGTPSATANAQRQALYDILGDREGIIWMNERNGWRIFDIRLSSPITESQEGVRVTSFELIVIACPN